MLERAGSGYSCIGAANADEALVHLQDGGQSIDLVPTDGMTPGHKLHLENERETADSLPEPFSRDELLDPMRTVHERVRD